MDPINGFILGGHYVPILSEILSYLQPEQLLKCSLVCKSWNELIKDNRIWINMYKKRYPNREVKQVPWYVYHALLNTDFFDTNLLQNGNGQLELVYWTTLRSVGFGFTVEDYPVGCPLLPFEEEDFNGFASCFATPFGFCEKEQIINLSNRSIYGYIFKNFKPQIYVSEWTCGRYNCGSAYNLKAQIECHESPPVEESYDLDVEEWGDRGWIKVEITIDEYPDDVKQIRFIHSGNDLKTREGHYGSKMAGGVVKILFDSIKSSDESGESE